MATLKISDLSVGDWVMVNGKPRKISVLAEVWNGSNEVLVGYIAHVSPTGYNVVFFKPIEWVKPIPITAEILEKNGWVFHKGSLWWVCDIDKDTRANVWLGENGECRVEVSVLYGESRSWSNYADVKLANAHIHLLQHALRLAGVEKEINL